MAKKPWHPDSQGLNIEDLKTEVLALREENKMLLQAIGEREELMDNMFSYLQNFAKK